MSVTAFSEPIDDVLWQDGELYTGGSGMSIIPSSGTPQIRRKRNRPHVYRIWHIRVPLTLMIILGEIVDLHHANSVPDGYKFAQESDVFGREIHRQLDAYGESLKDFEARASRPIRPN